MKQVWFLADQNGENKRMELLEVPVKEMGPNDVRVKIHYAALCASDLHQVTMGVMNMKPGHAMGHETSGVIEALGEQAKLSGLKVGDKVTMYPTIRLCGICDNCKQGRGQYCTNGDVLGGFAEYVVVDASVVYKLPDDADLRKYCLVEPLNCVIRAMDLAQIPQGATVALSGVGGIGAILLNAILLTGAAKVAVLDPVEKKRQLALAMGAQYAFDPTDPDAIKKALEVTDGKGFDFVFEASGVPVAAKNAFDLLGRCGTLVYFAVYPPTYEFPLNLHELYMKEGKILTVFETPDTMRRSIESIPRMQMDKIIGTIVPLEDIDKAWVLFKQSIYPKILIDCRKRS